jgi:hypothetical protein
MQRLSENLETQVTRIDQRTYHVLDAERYEIISGNTSLFRGLLFSPPPLCSNYVNVTLKDRMLTSLVLNRKLFFSPREKAYEIGIISLKIHDDKIFMG